MLFLGRPFKVGHVDEKVAATQWDDLGCLPDGGRQCPRIYFYGMIERFAFAQNEINAKQIRKRKKTSQKQRRVVKSSAGLWLRAQPNLRAAGHWLLGIFTGLWLDTTLGG